MPLAIPETPPCVLCLSAGDATAGGGLAADILTLASMGCHPLPVQTAALVRDTRGIDELWPVAPELIAMQVRAVLEDVPVAAFKLGFCGSVENVAVIAEILADYPDVPKLLAIPAAVRFLSMEPLLGPVDLNHIRLPHGSGRTWIDALQPWWVTPDMRTRLDLVIVGGESGPGARPMNPKWARSLRDQCNAAGVAFHFKQWGEYSWGVRHEPPQATEYPLKVGKARAGRTLDGRTWDEMPGEGEA